MRHIELNPVRTGRVGHPSEYLWSSYRHTTLGEVDELLSVHDEYRRLGKTDEERQAAYRQRFRDRIAQNTLEEIRQATNKAWVLGDDRFKRRIERQLQRPVAPRAEGVIANQRATDIALISIEPDPIGHYSSTIQIMAIPTLA